MLFFTAKTKFELNQPGKKPQLIDWDLMPTTAEDLEGNAIIRLKVCPYAYTNTENSGVSLGLRSIQLLQKGEAFGGDHDSASDFGKSRKPRKKKSLARRTSQTTKTRTSTKRKKKKRRSRRRSQRPRKSPQRRSPAPVEEPDEYEKEEEEEEEEAPKPKKKARG